MQAGNVFFKTKPPKVEMDGTCIFEFNLIYLYFATRACRGADGQDSSGRWEKRTILGEGRKKENLLGTNTRCMHGAMEVTNEYKTGITLWLARTSHYLNYFM